MTILSGSEEKVSVSKDLTTQTLDIRQTTHGSYFERSHVCNRIREAILQDAPELADDQLQSVIMIADKLSRIVCGKADTHDHWLDISGYAMLVADRLENENTAN